MKHAVAGAEKASTHGMPLTMREVAREAGVSIASVSRVLSGSRGVRPETERTVLETVERLQYRPNYIGRSLSLRSTSSIGLVVPDIASAFFPLLIEAFERALNSAGMSLLLADAQRDTERETRAIMDLVQRQVDGLVVSPCDARRSRSAIETAQNSLPVVQVDRYCTSKVPRVITEPLETIRLAVDHLYERGYKALAFVGGNSRASTAIDRERSFRRLVRDDGSARVVTGTFTIQSGREAAAFISKRWPEVDGIVCANDLIAVGVIQGLRDLGRSVPRDIGVTGCDDTLYASVSTPSLTTIAQPLDQMAAMAVDLMLKPTVETRTVVKLAPQLHAGGSTDRRSGHA
jgi:LacI family transcriptional regulator